MGLPPGLLCKDKLDDVCSHLHGFSPGGFRITMYSRVFPTITQITFIIVKTDQPPFVKSPTQL